MTYQIYHIYGKKVGVTTNAKLRIEREQGFSKSQYEVLDTCETPEQASKLEKDWQKKLGYKLDENDYHNFIELIKKTDTRMKTNVTVQTTTFPCPINKLRGRLMDNMGLEIDTGKNRKIIVDGKSIKWIMNNVKPSFYSSNKCFIYNEAYDKWVNKKESRTVNKDSSLAETFDNIRDWAEQRGIYNNGDAKTQYVKLMEEGGELAQAMLKQNDADVVDAIGDMVVVLTNLAHMYGYSIEHCVNSAYNEIKDRTGKMDNGTFIKDEQ